MPWRLPQTRRLMAAARVTMRPSGAGTTRISSRDAVEETIVSARADASPPRPLRGRDRRGPRKIILRISVLFSPMSP